MSEPIYSVHGGILGMLESIFTVPEPTARLPERVLRLHDSPKHVRRPKKPLFQMQFILHQPLDNPLHNKNVMSDSLNAN